MLPVLASLQLVQGRNLHGLVKMDLPTLLVACAPLVSPSTAQAVIAVESGGNPHAIGVVGGHLARQPQTLAEAIATVRVLEADGWNYSVGLGQINRTNFKRLRLTPETAFEPCRNLAAMQSILGECFERASKVSSEQPALRQALSCYYSGNFSTGLEHGYVDRVVAAWRATAATKRKEPTTPTTPSPTTRSTR